MQINTIKAGNRTLACAKAFNRIWQRFYDEELLVSSEKGELQLSIAPESPKSSIEVLADGTVKITAPDEKELFKSSMIFLQEDVSDKLQIGKTEIATSTQEKLLMVDIGRKYFSLAALKDWLICWHSLISINCSCIFQRMKGFGLNLSNTRGWLPRNI